MSLVLKTLTVKNFMSVGNQTQAVSFDRSDLTLVLGENLDLGGDDSGSRNGTGKTTIINALSYGLYGQALSNIKKSNLVNKTNNKHLMVTVEFDHNGHSYKIERGRNPNVLKFMVDGIEKEMSDTGDKAQGENKETQEEINRILGMSADMFKHLVALNTYTVPFLSLGAAKQREIIEQLLGITLLSEKAEALKNHIKETKDLISEEEHRIRAVKNANSRVEEQIDSLKKRQRMWLKRHQEDIDKLVQGIDDLDHVDIDEELKLHEEWKQYNEKLDIHNQSRAEKSRLSTDYAQQQKIIEKTKTEIESLEKHECYACGQEIHDDRQNEILAGKQEILRDAETRAQEIQERLDVQSGEEDVPVKPKKKTFYDKLEDAYNHRSTVENLRENLKAKRAEQDPYAEQIEEMANKAIEEIDYTHINALSQLKDHQDYLFKLLVNKDSFIRKRIIDQNLAFLNSRLTYYLNQMRLPHTVQFMNDLSVEIQELGRDLDFDNLSRGEQNRLILSLSWAFRDVWESLYQPINLLFIDELIDNGTDASGVESALGVLKKMARERNKSIWLVSHKDELAGRVNNILRVVKENGFTMYDNDVEVV